jgi:outer membrane receptor for monomeric catechols
MYCTYSSSTYSSSTYSSSSYDIQYINFQGGIVYKQLGRGAVTCIYAQHRQQGRNDLYTKAVSYFLCLFMK